MRCTIYCFTSYIHTHKVKSDSKVKKRKFEGYEFFLLGVVIANIIYWNADLKKTDSNGVTFSFIVYIKSFQLLSSKDLIPS